MLPLTDAALILQGGSFRCMFSAGAMDVLMEHGLWFSYVNGVSAGALAGCNYLSRQNGRTRKVNETFCTDPDFLSLRNRFRKKRGSLIPMSATAAAKAPEPIGSGWPVKKSSAWIATRPITVLMYNRVRGSA